MKAKKETMEEYFGEGTPTCCAQKLQSYQFDQQGAFLAFSRDEECRDKCEQQFNTQLTSESLRKRYLIRSNFGAPPGVRFDTTIHHDLN